MTPIHTSRVAPCLLALGILSTQPMCAHDPGDPHGQETGLRTLWVDSRLEDCVGVAPRTCLRVKRAPDADWELFYDSIDGFDYQEGFAYELLVRVRERDNPPADASSLVYELAEVRSMRESREGDAPRGLTGGAWQLASFAAGRGEVAEGYEATLELDSGAATAGGFAGCNRFGGGYQSEGDSLTFGMMHSTMMACPDEPRTRQEQAFLAALEEVAGFAVEGDRLRLLDGQGELLMTLVPRPDHDLVGTTWEATGINNGRQAVVSVDPTGVPTATFGSDGRVSGSGGCNRFQASYTAGDETIEIGPASATRRACAPPVTERELWFFDALESAATWHIDRDVLELRTESGSLAVSFRALDPAD